MPPRELLWPTQCLLRPAVLRSGVPNGTSLHADCVFRTSSKGNFAPECGGRQELPELS
ncbi:hypothetical protein X756_00025 [Mesorhizobium sp. LSHC412B00]|nr:hypothetical protein X756_00025 [Mesorhizobium sp. LSHC412B00]